MKIQRSRAFTIRVQLSEYEQEQWLPKIKADVMTYPTRFEKIVIGGPELAPTTGMRHVHIYVAFEHAKSKNQLPVLLQLHGLRPWIECAVKQDADRIVKHHCKLESKQDPLVLKLFEFPEELITSDSDVDARPLKRAKTTQDELRAAIETGNIDVVKNLNYMLYIKSKTAIEAECVKFRPSTDDRVYEHLWITGSTGKGKTALIKRLWPDAYWKDCCNPNFEEYNNQEVVVFDDFDNKRLRLLTVGKLKNLCNPAGDRCKINYGSCYVKAMIIVTSQYSLRDCFKHKGKHRVPVNPDWNIEEDPIDEDPDYQAIKRRFTEISIDKLLFQHNLQLKSKAAIRDLTPEQQASYDVFEPYDPEHNREVDMYSECNQSIRSSRTVGTQTSDDRTEDTTSTHPSELEAKTTTTTFSCTDQNCTLKGIWVGAAPGNHIHFKHQD